VLPAGQSLFRAHACPYSGPVDWREDGMIKTHGIAHFSIPVTNTERSKEFYTKILGMKLLADVDGMVFLDTGGDCVILVKVDPPISTAHIVNMHHSFMVGHDDYEGAVKDLKANGIEVLYDEDRRGGVVNGPRTYFNDPDGNTLEIIDLTSYKGNKV
jgi:catechol 2,3-dioxygenase-like lactoylglutathione lyase family enzyme